MTTAHFRKIIRDYYRSSGRHDLPWRKTRDPYAILVSEIMLQQTQVSRVEGYYEKFIKRFPDFSTLARAKTGDVLALWQGLGYNRRALSLHKLSTIVLEKFNGRLPMERAILETLPGIGKGTSGALRAFAFNKPEIFIETNIRRVFIHFLFPRSRVVTDEAISRYIESTLDRKDPRKWYWALMDYGAMLGVSARNKNPNRRSAHYKKQNPFGGSDRELRGKILRLMLARRKMQLAMIEKVLGAGSERTGRIVASLHKEGFLGKKGKYLSLT